LKDVTTVGITAGASTPSSFVDAFVELLKTHGADSVGSLATIDERVWFALPSGLEKEAAARTPSHPILKKHAIGASSKMNAR
jgi:hypothetical protein